MIFGDQPRFTDPQAADELIAANPQLQRVTVERAGDLPQIERPDETASVVEDFLLRD
jgi:pimeloyl-ACP methyl ester carboxylesterase